MGNYLLRRVLLCVPVLIGITVINFTFMRLAPGDPVSMMIPQEVLEAGGGVVTDEWRHEMEGTSQSATSSCRLRGGCRSKASAASWGLWMRSQTTISAAS